MALRVSSDVKNEKKPAPVAKPGTVLIELVLHNRYNRKGTHFEKGVVYRVSQKDAMELLSETDHGRQRFKLHQTEKPKPKPKLPNIEDSGAVDLSAKDLQKGTKETPDSDNKDKPTRIDVGDESELLSIIGQDEAGTVQASENDETV